MGSKPNISSKVYYTKHNKIPLKAYYQEESSHDSDYFILFCSENKKKPSQLLIAANDTLTLTSKKQGFKKLLVKVKEFEPTPHNQNCLGYIYQSSVEELWFASLALITEGSKAVCPAKGGAS